MYIMRFLPQDSCRILALKIEIQHFRKAGEVFLFRVFAVLRYIDKREVKRLAVFPHNYGRHGAAPVCRHCNLRKRSPEALLFCVNAEPAERTRAKGNLPRRYRGKARISRQDKFLTGLLAGSAHARDKSVMRLACRHSLVL